MAGTAPTSTIPAAKAAVVDLLDGASWPEPRPQISYGVPDTVDRECVWVGETAGAGDAAQSWHSIGRGPLARDESYALALGVVAELRGATQREATERAFALMAVVERVLLDAPSLGVPGVTVAAVRQPTHTEYVLFDGERAVGRGCEITSAVRVQAQLRRS